MVYVLEKFKHYLLGNKFFFTRWPHGLGIPCIETSTIGMNCEVTVIIPGIQFLGGVETKEFSFNAEHSFAISWCY